MKLSTRARYALRLVVELAKNDDGDPMSLTDVASSTQLPKRYLDQLAIGLKSDELIRSVRGRGGGYQLTRAPEDISVHDVARAAIGPINIVDCVLSPDLCSRSETCEFRCMYQRINNEITKVLDDITVADLVERGRLTVDGFPDVACNARRRASCK